MRISVVTPSLNMGAYLDETILSVLENLEPEDEYFVVDGGSTDGSLDIIRKYQNRITGWVSEPDHSYADAIGKGFKRSSGDILCWVNSSDLLAPGALARIKRQFRSGEIDLVYGDAMNIDEKGMVLWKSPVVFRDLKNYMLYGGGAPWQIACFWRRSAYEAIGGIRADLKYAADYDLFLRLCVGARAGYMPSVLGAHRYHAGQISVVSSEHYRQERLRVQREVLRGIKQSRATKALLRASYWVAGKAASVRSRVYAAFDPRRGTLLGQNTDWSNVNR